MKPHKHAELIKAWADGAEIEVNCGWAGWQCATEPDWNDENREYRIKAEPKPDVVHHYFANWSSFTYERSVSKQNLKLTFDGETGKLKSAEVLK
jgi:hypothetical protein